MVGLFEAEGLVGEGAHHPGGVAVGVSFAGELVADLVVALGPRYLEPSSELAGRWPIGCLWQVRHGPRAVVSIGATMGRRGLSPEGQKASPASQVHPPHRVCVPN